MPRKSAAKKAKNALLDEEDGDVDMDAEWTVNEAFAKGFTHNKEREDLHRLEELKKQGIVGSDSDGSESEGEDELGKLPVETDIQIFETLAKVKKKDPVIYQPEVKFNDGEDEEDEEDAGVVEEKKKQLYLNDVQARQLLDGDDGRDEVMPKKKPPKFETYADEQEELRHSLLRSVAEAEDSEDDGVEKAGVGGGTHSYGSGAYLLWPGNEQLLVSADERAACFSGLQKEGGVMNDDGKAPGGNQASTLLELMTIRAYHSKSLRSCGLGTALGFRTRRGELTSIPAIIVFVARKVHTQWLHEMQILPSSLSGPGGIWCDIDVVEFSYFGVPATMPKPKEQMFSEVLDGLRGMDATIGSGTQVASPETYGTLGAVVQSQIGARELGFITNRHVAVDLDYPSQRMFHPLPPNLGPGVYLGAVKRATSFVKDDLWYGVFAGVNPETFVRADGAFIPFCETFDISKVATTIRGVGTMGEVSRVDLQSQIGSIVGRHVVKVGRSSGVTKGVIMGYAVEYNDENGVCFLTDFLIVGENKQSFDLEGDSGGLILLTYENDAQKPQPVGLIWGGTANRGRLRLRNEQGPENWTSGVDLGRLLDILQLDIIRTDKALQEAVVLQERVKSASMISSPRWLAKDRIPEPVSSPPHDEPGQDPEREPEEEEEPETSSPAAKDLIFSSSIGNFPLRRDDPRPSLDLADEDLSMRLSGPSSSGTVHPNALNHHTVHQNAAPNHPDPVHDQNDPHQLDTVNHPCAENTSDTSDTLLLLPPTCAPSRDRDVHESRSRGIKARKLSLKDEPQNMTSR